MEPKQIDVKFEYSRPEDEPAVLALHLGEILQDIYRYEQDYNSFTSAVQSERIKATQLQAVIFELKERQRGKVYKTSRMDPFAFYDLDKCNEELAILKDRALDLQKLANKANSKIQDCKQEVDILQRKLLLANK